MNIVSSEIELSDLIFSNNTGSFSFFEEEHSIPFFDILTMQKYKLNFFMNEERPENICTNEISIIGSLECLHDYSTAAMRAAGGLHSTPTHIKYPHMRGSIYLNGIHKVKIIDSSFNQNDAGPLFTNVQDIGLTDEDAEYTSVEPEVQRASAIYIAGRLSQITVKGSTCKFANNSLDFMLDKVKSENPEMHSYFPEDYFDSAHSPLINV